MWFKFFSLVILIASWFVIPMDILKVISDPVDYWKWFGPVIWVYLLVSNSITQFSAVANMKEDK